MLPPGTPAPDIESLDQWKKPFRLAELRGHWVVLYLYAKDDTPGCTVEACAFRDQLEAFAKLGVEVVGISTQDADSHRRFAEKHGIAFRLVADADKRVARAYDALGILGLARRTTYLVDPDGVIRDAYRSELDPASHVAHAKEALAKLRAPA